jgi:hypothetical protein
MRQNRLESCRCNVTAGQNQPNAVQNKNLHPSCSAFPKAWHPVNRKIQETIPPDMDIFLVNDYEKNAFAVQII